MNFTKDKIDLDKIRSELVRLEDSIIFALIERFQNNLLSTYLYYIRAQFSLNQSIYIPNHPNFQFDDNFKGTFLGYFLHLIESAHAKVRRYTSPDEYPFTANLPAPILPPITFPKLLIPNTINKNAKLLEIYTSSIVPLISIPGDDLNYGSAATKDGKWIIFKACIKACSFFSQSKFCNWYLEESTLVNLLQKPSLTMPGGMINMCKFTFQWFLIKLSI